MKANANLMTPEQVAQILQVNVLTIYSYIKKGNLGAIRLGRSYRVIPEDVDRLLELNRVKKTNPEGNFKGGKI